MKELRAPFDSVFSAISYYLYNNPVRMKGLNIDQEIRSKVTALEFSGDHPCDIYASVTNALKYVLNRYSDPLSKKIFSLYHLSADQAVRPDKREIAQSVGVSIKHVSKTLNTIEKDLERELIRRELLDPLPGSMH